MTSANALVLGDARWKLARPICGNLKLFHALFFFLACPSRTGWLDGFGVPAPVVEPAEAQCRLVL